MLMLSAEARYNDWSLFSDVVYLDFGDQSGSVDALNYDGERISVDVEGSVTTSFTGSAWTLGLGHALIDEPAHRLELLGGLRYFSIETGAEWQLEAAITSDDGDTTLRPANAARLTKAKSCGMA